MKKKLSSECYKKTALQENYRKVWGRKNDLYLSIERSNINDQI